MWPKCDVESDVSQSVLIYLVRKSFSSLDCQHLCLKKVWKFREVLNVHVTTGHRPAQAQEEPAAWGRLSRFCQRSQKFFAN